MAWTSAPSGRRSPGGCPAPSARRRRAPRSRESAAWTLLSGSAGTGLLGNIPPVLGGRTRPRPVVPPHAGMSATTPSERDVANLSPRPYHVSAATWSSRARSPRRPTRAPDRAHWASRCRDEGGRRRRSRSQEERATDDGQRSGPVRDAGGVHLRVAAARRVAGAQHDRRRRPVVRRRRAAGGAGRVRRRARRAPRCPTPRPWSASRSAASSWAAWPTASASCCRCRSSSIVLGLGYVAGGAVARATRAVRAGPGAADRAARQLRRPSRRWWPTSRTGSCAGAASRSRSAPAATTSPARSGRRSCSTSSRRVGWRQTIVGVGVFCVVTMLPLALAAAPAAADRCTAPAPAARSAGRPPRLSPAACRRC